MAETPQRPTFDEFYSNAAARLVRHSYALTADMAEAQDIAQEAFARAWQRWPAVRECDSPEAWVRRVATNLAASRWRRIRVARAAAGQPAQQHAPEVSTDTVALVCGLRTLPERQRTVLVLHYMCDLSVDQIASELGCPAGSVKSWLSRGRTALAEAVRVVEPDGLESAGPQARAELAETSAATAGEACPAEEAGTAEEAGPVQAIAALAAALAAAPAKAAAAEETAPVADDASAEESAAAEGAASADNGAAARRAASADRVAAADRGLPDLMAAPVLFAPAVSLHKDRLRPLRSCPARSEPEASHA